MDTQEFRETVLQTAVDIGELTKAGNEFITKTGKKFTLEQFTESLSSKWFTNDVLLKTLSKYSSAVQDVYEIASKEGISLKESPIPAIISALKIFFACLMPLPLDTP